MTHDKEKLPELPKGWVWAKIGDVTSVASGGTPSTKIENYFKGNIPWITPADLSDFYKKYIAKGARFISKEGLQNSSAVLLPAGTVLFSSRAPIGYVAIAANNICTNQGFKNFIPSESVFNEYLFYYLKGNKQLAETFASGTTFLELSASNAAKLPFPLPPLPEQRRIVAKIEELFTRLDAGVEALRKVKTEIKRYRQAVLKHAFEGRLTEEWREAHKGELEPASVLLERIKAERKTNTKGKIKELPPVDASELTTLPEGWGWTRVGALGDVITGTTPSKSKLEYYSRDYSFFKPTDLNAGYYVKSSEDGLSEEGIKQARFLPEKSILVTCIGATIGKTGLIRVPGVSNQQINALVPANDILPEFVYFICISSDFQKSVVNNASATTLPILNKSKFELLQFPLPPLPEQNKIVEEIERHFSIADEVEASVDQSLKQAERLRQSILKRAFEGRLVPQDPTDEPAEKLIERIKLEKTKQSNEGKIKQAKRKMQKNNLLRKPF